MPQINISCKASMHVGKKWSAAHNRRDYDKDKWNLDGHIQADRSDLNVTLCDMDYKTWFHQTFDAAIDEFNAKNAGKHNDRLIDKDKYCTEQFGKVQECIIQLGDHASYMEMVDKVGVAAADQLHIQFLTDAFKQWQKENPAFRVFSAIIHMDETKDGTPHLHLDFMPVAQSKRGLSVKVNLDGALKENGFERKKNHKYAEMPIKLWLRAQRERIETLAAQYIDLIPSEHDTGRQHIETWQYRSQQAREACAEMETEKQRIIAEIEPLRNLKTGIDEIEDTGKKILPGVIAVKKKDLDTVKEQAKAYAVNRDEIETVRERLEAIRQREKRASQREQQLDKRAKEITELQVKAMEKYNRQIELNQRLEQAERKCQTQAEIISELRSENMALTAKIEQIKGEFTEKVKTLTEKLKGAYMSVTSVVKAARMLKYDKKEGYKVANLTKQQETLIDGIAKYGAKWAREDGFPEMAEEMEKYVGLSNGIRNIVEPPEPEHHMSYGGRSL